MQLSNDDVSKLRRALKWIQSFNISGPYVKARNGGLNGGASFYIGAPPQDQRLSSDRSAVLLVRNNLTAINEDHTTFDPPFVGAEGVLYEALLIPFGTNLRNYWDVSAVYQDAYNFLQGTLAPDCLAIDFNQEVGTDAATYAGGVQSAPRPLRGSVQNGFRYGSEKATGDDVESPSVTTYIISPGVKRQRFNAATKAMQISYVLHPEHDPVDPEELWVTEYFAGPCAAGE